MMEPEIRNARIESTHLGAEDHGILSAYLRLTYGRVGQSFGGYAFDQPIMDATGKFLCREGVAFGMEFIRRVLEVTGAECWEKLPGTPIRVRAHNNGVDAIGHYIEDRWFDPKADLAHLAKL